MNDGLCGPCFKKAQARPENVIQRLNLTLDGFVDDETRTAIFQQLSDIVAGTSEPAGRHQAELLNHAIAILERMESSIDPFDDRFVLKLLVLCRLGRYDDAYKTGKRFFEMARTWSTATGLANVAKRLNLWAEVRELLDHAAELDQTDTSALLDLGDHFLEQRNWHLSTQYYNRVIKRNSTHSWALASRSFCAFQLTQDREDLAVLERIANENNHDCECGAGIFGWLVTDGASLNGQTRAKRLLRRCKRRWWQFTK